MKQITMHPILPSSPLTAEDLNGNIFDARNSLSDIDHLQLPAGCITPAKFQPLDDVSRVALAQDEYQSAINHWYVLAHSPLSTPGNLITAPIGNAWTPLATLGGDLDIGSELFVRGEQGVLQGYWQIDSEQRIAATETATSKSYANPELWWEFAIFANDAMIAKGPRLYAGRHTLKIPFVAFTGPDDLFVNIRIRANRGTQRVPESTASSLPPLVIHDFKCLARTTGV
jgi:hypothetical protein